MTIISTDVYRPLRPLSVIVLAAGNGTRMGTTLVPKTLLLYEKAAILDHILNSWQEEFDCTFYVAHQEGDSRVLDYIKASGRHAKLVSVPIAQESVSEGPVLSMSVALAKVSKDLPVAITVTDTVYNLPNGMCIVGSNVLLVDRRDEEDHPSYLMATNHKHFHAKDKVVCPSTYFAWSGVSFFYRPGPLLEVMNEVVLKYRQDGSKGEISHAALFNKFAKHHSLAILRVDFTDLGTAIRYAKATQSVTAGCDYTKSDQITYFHSSVKTQFGGSAITKVIKYFASEADAAGFCERFKFLQLNGAHYLLPTRVDRYGCFVSYPYIRGTRKKVVEANFKDLLDLLERQLWALTFDQLNVDKVQCYPMYTVVRDTGLFWKKTRSRVTRYINRNASTVDPAWIQLLELSFWQHESYRPANIHGDLTFDNMVLDTDSNLRLIDWRTNVGTDNRNGIANLFYDLAKIWVSTELDFEHIKLRGLEDDGSLPLNPHRERLQEAFSEWCFKRSINFQAVTRSGILVLAAMCDVHKEPLARALYKHSLKLALQLTKEQS